jgi:hypothetical protein
MFRLFSALPPLLASALLSASAASAGAQSASADPLDAKAQVPPLKYRSSLEGYRRLSDEKVAPWKEANETTARIGGWRAYARETREGASPAAAPASAPRNGHPGHHK